MRGIGEIFFTLPKAAHILLRVFQTFHYSILGVTEAAPGSFRIPFLRVASLSTSVMIAYQDDPGIIRRASLDVLQALGSISGNRNLQVFRERPQ
ncbi:MAG: hypothetical protein C4293_10465 [Nitrospiraceae bacterium]